MGELLDLLLFDFCLQKGSTTTNHKFLSNINSNESSVMKSETERKEHTLDVTGHDASNYTDYIWCHILSSTPTGDCTS